MARKKERPFVMGLFSEEGSKKKIKPLARILDKEGYDLHVAKVGSKKSDDEVFRKVKVVLKTSKKNHEALKRENHEALKRVKLKHELRRRGIIFSSGGSTNVLKMKLKDGGFMGFTGD